METFIVEVVYDDGGIRTYETRSLNQALELAIGIATHQAITQIIVTERKESRVFTYRSPPKVDK